MAVVGGGWKQGVPGYIAWALMPYAVLAVILLSARLFRIDRSVRLAAAWASMVITLGGPLLYIDAMYVHVDAQGALVVLMIPVIQTALSMLVVAVMILWQWRIRRITAKPTYQEDRKTSPLTTTLWRVIRCNKPLRIICVSSAIIAALLYLLISLLQRADLTTIGIAKEVDAFIIQYCEDNKSLPTAGVLQGQFPTLTREAGWFYYTDDKTWLRVQYPMRWWNKKAIGERRISEFTATVYAYSVDYTCKGAP
jgi:hypothetical protein